MSDSIESCFDFISKDHKREFSQKKNKNRNAYTLG